MPPEPPPARDARIVALIGTGHFLSHFYMLCLPPLFLCGGRNSACPTPTLGLSVALMSGTTAILQTPVGFWVDRWGARPFLVGGTLLMALSVSAMAFAPAFWMILPLAVLSGIGNSVIHPADYAIMAGSINKSFLGRAFALHTFTGNLGFAARPAGHRPAAQRDRTGGGAADRRAARHPGGGRDPAAERRAARPGQAEGERRTSPAGRELLLCRPMLLFFAFFLLVLDGRLRHPVLAGDGARQALGHPGAGRLRRAHRLHDRRHLRHAGRRLDRRQVEAQPARHGHAC